MLTDTDIGRTVMLKLRSGETIIAQIEDLGEDEMCSVVATLKEPRGIQFVGQADKEGGNVRAVPVLTPWMSPDETFLDLDGILARAEPPKQVANRYTLSTTGIKVASAVPGGPGASVEVGRK